MPHISHKVPIAEELKENLPKPCVDLMTGSETNSGLLGQLYHLIGASAGSLELAYRRGYDLGYHDAENGKKQGESLHTG